MSFYSPIDRLAQNLPRPKGTGSEFMTELSKMPGYKSQEAEDRGLQALVNLPKMERAQFLEALKAKRPVTPEVKTLMPNDEDGYEPHHEEYTLPGGTNYREILLKHPQGEFKGVPQHFGGMRNVLASVRAKDRRGPNGEKILHIEELQSDWHQQGREKGYTPPDVAKQINAAERAHRELKQQLDQAKDSAALAERGLVDPTTKRMRDLNPEMNQRLEASKIRHNNTIMELMPQVMKAEAEHQDLLHQSKNTVPDAPFKKNWHEMALKKMIHHAAANGYDSIAITPGAEQADRYGLAKHIGMLLYDPERQHFQAFKPNREMALVEHGATPERVSQLVGKELTQKLLESPKHGGFHYIEGDDMKVGGEGMKGFYDKIVPNFLNQFGKKYGAKVGQIQVPVVHALQGLRRVNNYPDDPPLNLHHFPITPEMREDVTKNGVPLYAKGGSVEDEGDVPKKTVKAYKLFRVHPKHPGKLFPLFVDANTPVEMDKWIDAKEGEMAKGKVKSKIGPLAYRPGWHAGDLPIATHIGEKSDPSLTAPDVRPDNHAWAEVEMPDDVDWQAEATKRGTNAQGRVIPVKAHITDQIPKGGHYRYKTNPNMTGNWLIGGSMKVNRVLTDKEVAKINKAAGLADLPRAQPFKGKKFGFAGGGTVAPDEWKAEAHVNHMAGGGKVKPLSERFDFGKAGEFDPIGNAKKSLRGAYDVVSKIPGNLKRLVTDPVAYAKSLPAPGIEQLAGAFNPAHIGGIMMGPGSRTWNQKSFEDAVHLAGSTGNLMPPKEVWKRTGNIPNARDFVPRQEINDSNAKFYTPAELKYNLDEAKAMLKWAKQQPLLPKWSTLPDEHRNNFLVYADKLNTVVQDLSQDPAKGIKAKYVLDHPELYAAYPELGEMLISQPAQPHATTKGGFNSKRPEVTIFPQADPRGTAIHEMQHAVQNIEGMSPGTNPLLYGGDLANYLKFHKAVTDAYPNLNPKQAAEDAMHGWYRSHMGEAEARQATKRMDMSPQERLNNFPDYDTKPNWLIDKPAEAPDISLDPALKYERPASYAKGGRIKPIGYTKEQVTVSPNLDAMRYELMSVKRYTKKVK